MEGTEQNASADLVAVLARIQARLELDRETEREVLDEIRSHLEEVVAEAQARGLSETAALAEAAARFGLEETGSELQQTHAGWGTAEGVLAAGLPVLCALVLRAGLRPRWHHRRLATGARAPGLLDCSRCGFVDPHV